MSSWQKTIVVGYVGGDVRLDVLKDGTHVASFSLAVTETWQDDGERKERTTWFRVSVWREKALHIARYVKKGVRLLVEGRVDADAYLDKNQRPAASLKLTALDIRFLSPVSAADANGKSEVDHVPDGVPDDALAD